MRFMIWTKCWSNDHHHISMRLRQFSMILWRTTPTTTKSFSSAFFYWKLSISKVSQTNIRGCESLSKICAFAFSHIFLSIIMILWFLSSCQLFKFICFIVVNICTIIFRFVIFHAAKLESQFTELKSLKTI